METDDALVEALARDLDTSFESLVLAHQDRLYSIALRMLGDARDAEEVAQDALVRAYRALATYDRARIGALLLRPWLATIVLNLCRSRLERRRRSGARPLSLDLPGDDPGRLAEPVADPEYGPVRIADRREENARWAIRVAALPPAYRAAIVLRHVDGLTYPEIAIALGRPEGTVKAQVHRGVALLRAAYEADGRREHEELSA
ncbi:MAG: RNA polymerase sigma factor [Chloroflexota bacterium]